MALGEALGELDAQQTDADLITTQVEPPPAPVVDDVVDEDAFDLIKESLAEWGLDGLGTWAWDMLVSGKSSAEVILNLRQQDLYKARFKANDLRRQAGLYALSEAEILRSEAAYTTVLRNAGLAPGFYDSPDDFVAWLGGDVSANEVADRIGAVKKAIEPNLMDVRSQMRDFYGVEPDDGALLAWALDPSRGLSIIERQIQAATAGAAASIAGLELSQERAEKLAPYIRGEGEAISGFSDVAEALRVQQFQAGAQTGPLTQAEAEAATFAGDQGAREKRRKRAQEAASVFSTAGGAATTSKGVAGLGEV